MRIIPAIDIIEGKCVRLTQGDYNQKKIYNADPLDMALRLEGHGLQFLHLVDLDGAKEGKVINYKVVEKIASKTSLFVDFGGGIASDDDIRIAFECGVCKVNIGSVAVKNKERCLAWITQYGAEKIILSADAKKEKIVVSGWQEGTDLWIYDLIEQYQVQGISEVACTDVECDGMLQGPSIDLYKKLKEKFPKLKIIASGGVSTLKDVEELIELDLDGAIIGRAIYEGKISLEELRAFV